MKKLLFLTILLSISLFAERIAIAKTSNKHTLKSIHKKLKRVGVKMYFLKKGGYYLVYSQEFRSKKEAMDTLQKVRRYFPNALLYNNTPQSSSLPSTSFAFKGEKRKNYIYTQLSYGKSYVQSQSAFTLSNTLEVLSGGVGYFFAPHLGVFGYYTLGTNGNYSLSNIIAELNYYQKVTQEIELFTGVDLGYSTLTFDVAGATSSKTLLFGFNFGANYDFKNNVYAGVHLQNFYYEHTVYHTETLRSTFSSQNNLKLFVGYRFSFR